MLLFWGWHLLAMLLFVVALGLETFSNVVFGGWCLIAMLLFWDWYILVILLFLGGEYLLAIMLLLIAVLGLISLSISIIVFSENLGLLLLIFSHYNEMVNLE